MAGISVGHRKLSLATLGTALFLLGAFPAHAVSCEEFARHYLSTHGLKAPESDAFSAPPAGLPIFRIPLASGGSVSARLAHDTIPFFGDPWEWDFAVTREGRSEIYHFESLDGSCALRDLEIETDDGWQYLNKRSCDDKDIGACREAEAYFR